LIYVKN